MLFCSMFSGFGLADIGATLAGCELGWAIELDPTIAEVSKQLKHDVIVKSVIDVDFKKLERPDILWASPPCPNFSAAKQNAAETELDIALAQAIADAITELQPQYFVLENVEGYKRSNSIRKIEDTLYSLGYWVDRQILNAADFGVPQTRRRLILRAVKAGFVPFLPAPIKWVGWYAAIEDLIPDLKETELADWQIARLPEPLVSCLFQAGNPNGNRIEKFRRTDYPAPTVCASEPLTKALLVPGGNSSSFSTRNAEEPARTVGDAERPGNMPRAILVDGIGNRGDSITIADDECPSFTVTASSTKHPARAILIESKNQNQKYGDGLRYEAEPCTTVTTDGKPSHQPKALLLDVGNQIRESTVREEHEPSMTVTAEKMRRPISTPKVVLNGARIVQMSARCLARFQTMPDCYELPTKNSLACKGIGNGVPCLFAEKIIRSLFWD